MQRVLALDALLRLLEAADDTLEVQSEAYAGVNQGVLYLHQMIVLAQQKFPEKTLIFWVDCADRAGTVMEAIRIGLTHLMADLPDESFRKLEEIAAQSGAQLRRR